MFEPTVTALVVQMYKSGKLPSQILREIALLHQDASVPDLMKLLQEAFSLSYTSVQCIGGWWYDGSGELTDAQLDSFLIREIKKKVNGSGIGV